MSRSRQGHSRGCRTFRESGQAAVELLAGLPLLLVVGALLCQLLAVGHSAVLAATASEAGALALAGGGDPAESARRALPGLKRGEADVRVRGGRVTVRLRPPSLLAALARQLEVRSTARVVP